MTHISSYYDLERSRRLVEDGAHREAVGGLWDEIGILTFEFLRQRGLQPGHRVLDIGCGCLRVGVHLVRYVDSGNYFGMDISEELLVAGHSVELAKAGLDERVPRQNLVCDSEFNFSLLRSPAPFDFCLAQSLFTHLPLNHIRLCLKNLEAVTAPGSRLFATIFECSASSDWFRPQQHERGGVVTHPARDPYHYRPEDLSTVVGDLAFHIGKPFDWGHPRDQSMVEFIRV